MSNIHARTAGLATIAGASIALAAAIGSGSAAAGSPHTSFHGVFHETPVGAAEPLGYDIHGTVKMTVGATGTVVTINVSGLDPDKNYGSHLHDGTCASGGGGHYKDDTTGGGAPPNELWLTTGGTVAVPNPGGVVHAAGSAEWQARTSGGPSQALSVVVHEPGGVRIACADLG
jgi:hypothetical protein